ncbi:MalY/PatB family protein [Longirhabdus pacifica]|uniref:MalY/PatB family protein n=1 Tax=Longirhabdus pacifica TaxID=2305227 RepID=UPI0010087917|nr:MalY/PatB family protein [Longirhabdus pacifica]
MTIDFNQKLDRKNTLSYKWDQSERLFGHDDLLPLWVADMDFQSPPEVREAIINRAEHGVYGYSFLPESYHASIVNWFEKRHGWKLNTAWLSHSPGIVTSLSLAVEIFSQPGDLVMLQSPVYYPFYDVITMNDRKVAKNPLILKDGKYEMDLENLEQWMKDGAKLLLLCNPHNPGGRVWTREELQRVGDLCHRYDVTVIADEIHCDLTLSGNTYTPYASISENMAMHTVTCLAATKTFNLPGIQSSFMVIQNEKWKRKLDKRIKTLSLHMTNCFAPYAVQAAYDHGSAWLDELLAYVDKNVTFAVDYFAEHLPKVKPMSPEGTYLLWIDCRELGLDVAGLKELMFKEAGVVFNEGSIFGSEGKGFLRINLACPQEILAEGLRKFCAAAHTITTNA